MTGREHSDGGPVAETTAAEPTGAEGDAPGAADAAPLRIVFCGGCNPHIDRGAVAAAAQGEATGAAAGATLFVSGCTRACASDHRLTGERPDHVVVAGETVEGRPTREDGIPAAVRRTLEE